jgi:alkanesulfonate monooxygenase SsuD/methylene tetrahydromethanopterin reductase-like flavin-dependent oxidoreductase (luciferase family)
MNRAGKKPKVMLALSELFTLVPNNQEQLYIEFGKIAEGEGIEAVFVSEHVVMGPSAGALGRPANPREFVLPGMQDPMTPWLSPLIKLAAIAGATSTLRVISAALIAPLRHPIPLAKDLATLDLISGGRFTVMPTVSWHDEEYRAMQIDFTTRGRRLDEHLEIWKRLWEDSPAAFDGEFYQFSDVYFSPKPDRKQLKLWFGGMSLRPGFLNRIAAHADGLFMGFPLSPDDIALLDRTFAAAGRSADELEIAGWVLPTFPDDEPADLASTLQAQLPTLVSQGCDIVAIKPSHYFDDPSEMADFCRRTVRHIDDIFG